MAMTLPKLAIGTSVNLQIISYEGEQPDKFNPTEMQYKWNVRGENGHEYTYYAKARVHEQLMMAQQNNSGAISLSHDAFTNKQGQPRSAYNVNVPNGKSQPIPQKPSTPSVPQFKPRDYDEEARGKCRHGFAVEAFKLGMKPDEATKKLLDTWTAYSMTGKFATPDDTAPWDNA